MEQVAGSARVCPCLPGSQRMQTSLIRCFVTCGIENVQDKCFEGKYIWWVLEIGFVVRQVKGEK